MEGTLAWKEVPEAFILSFWKSEVVVRTSQAGCCVASAEVPSFVLRGGRFGRSIHIVVWESGGSRPGRSSGCPGCPGLSRLGVVWQVQSLLFLGGGQQ